MLGCDSFVKAGWVHNPRAHLFKHSSGERWLVMGKVCLRATDSSSCNMLNICIIQVKHSEMMTATPLIPWVVCQRTGDRDS